MRVRFPSPAPHTKTVATEACPRITGLCQTRVSVPARATFGHTYPHLGTHPSASEDAQLVSSCSPASVLRSSNVTQGVSPQVRARCERAQITTPRRNATSDPMHAPALDAEMPVRLTIASRATAASSAWGGRRRSRARADRVPQRRVRPLTKDLAARCSGVDLSVAASAWSLLVVEA